MERNFDQNSENKVKFILALFERYQSTLDIDQQISLLTMWVASCVQSEEFEMAAALQKERSYIKNNPEDVPKRIGGDFVPNDMIVDNPLFKIVKVDDTDVTWIPVEETKKASIYNKIIDRIKKFLNGRFNKRGGNTI